MSCDLRVSLIFIKIISKLNKKEKKQKYKKRKKLKIISGNYDFDLRFPTLKNKFKKIPFQM